MVAEITALAIDDLPEALREPERRATVSARIHLLGPVSFSFDRDGDYGHLTITGSRDGCDGRFTLTVGGPYFSTPATVIEQLEAVIVGLREMAAEAQR